MSAWRPMGWGVLGFVAGGVASKLLFPGESPQDHVSRGMAILASIAVFVTLGSVLESRRPSFLAWILLGAVGLLVTATMIRRPREPAQARPTLLERMAMRADDSLHTIPELRDQIEHLSAEQASAYIQRYAARGFPRLDDEAVAERGREIATLLPRMTDRVCAAVARGTASPAQQYSFLQLLDSGSLERWTRGALRAARAEAAQRPVRVLNVNEFARVVSAVELTLTSSERSRLPDVLSNLGAAEDSDACWAARTLYSHATALSVEDQSVMLRGLQREAK